MFVTLGVGCWLNVLFVWVFFAEKLLVILRDGRKLVGILRSFDQFGTYP